MTLDQLDKLSELYPDIHLQYPTSFHEAVLGVASTMFGGVDVERLLISKPKCIELLVERDGLTLSEAEEYFDYNIAGSHFDGEPMYFTPAEELV